jgi:chromate transporter
VLKLFLRFLRFGALAWGGSVAQIAMIRQELVDEERWISSAQFNRVLAVYQVLQAPRRMSCACISACAQEAVGVVCWRGRLRAARFRADVHAVVGIRALWPVPME